MDVRMPVGDRLDQVTGTPADVGDRRVSREVHCGEDPGGVGVCLGGHRRVEHGQLVGVAAEVGECAADVVEDRCRPAGAHRMGQIGERLPAAGLADHPGVGACRGRVVAAKHQRHRRVRPAALFAAEHTVDLEQAQHAVQRVGVAATVFGDRLDGDLVVGPDGVGDAEVGDDVQRSRRGRSIGEVHDLAHRVDRDRGVGHGGTVAGGLQTTFRSSARPAAAPAPRDHSSARHSGRGPVGLRRAGRQRGAP